MWITGNPTVSKSSLGTSPPFPYECGESVGTTAVEDGEGNSQGVCLTAHG